MVVESNAIIDFGYWSVDERAGHWLPCDYFPEEYLKRISIDRPSQNIPPNGGFILSDLIIPLYEIKSGGVQKDGIPAILNPSFQKQNDDEIEQILGLSLNGIQKAYPINILNYHEVVNDMYGNQPVLVTFCPLCGSGVGFLSTAQDKKLTCGVSGLLYNSDVLLYDHQTESLWSQLMSTSISGEYSGTELEMISLTHTSWKEWKRQYPESQLLSKDTGHSRNYSESPYGSYLSNEGLMFPVSKNNKSLPNKEVILGIQVGDKFKAYPITRLKEQITTEKFSGTEIQIVYDKESNTAWLGPESSENAKSTRLFWFAWFAFHPNTEIFNP
ncbi:MAG: DUF3179 domain-containing protein [Cytophagales bacterium]|nr:DUF3179 domain-containing protein [Cytophagales bacterium]